MKKVRKLRMDRLLILLMGVLLIAISILGARYNIFPAKKYTAADFSIEVIKSSMDYDNDGIDDYADFLAGAKKDAANHPAYNGTYWPDGGYPSDNYGVCTDVIWRAFREAGYCLRDMVDNDIRAYPDDYPDADPDINIDFRRVSNLEDFFDKYAISLTTDINKIEEWMPGDIVVFNEGMHIGMVSDYRNRKGQVYIIHNGGQPNRDEDYLKRGTVYKHYRFDASLCKDILVRWY
ncbi:MAG: DUF1287 domain-containing protein [Erysipelotrichaceae bacterium]|nr:DUF1287 domain-containing protein [Erysipelotrichaceae bacterium]